METLVYIHSEWVSPRDERRAFISGFSGSAGWAVITATEQAVWTDSRYWLQSDQQLDCNWYLMRDGMSATPTMEQWIAEKLAAGDAVSSDARTVPRAQWESWVNTFGWCHGQEDVPRLLCEPGDVQPPNRVFTAQRVADLRAIMASNNIAAYIVLTNDEHQVTVTGELLVETVGNFVDDVWGTDRPPYPTDPAFSMNEATYTGLTWQEKVTAIASKVRMLGATSHVVTAMDEVAWLLNVRAADITTQMPVVRSYVTIELNGNGIPSEAMPTVSWFVDPSKMTPELNQFLGVGTQDGVKIYLYEDIWTELIALGTRTTSVLLAEAFSYNVGSSQAVYSVLPPAKVIFDRPPVAVMKSQKNPTEAQGMKNAHVRDAAALIIFLAKLEAGVKAGESWDEMSASAELETIRYKQMLSRGPSFSSISAAGWHASMPHYEPTPDTNSPINDTAIYKLDSGGQYLDGTTDVTRTVHFGTATQDQIDTYTRVLAGCASINSAVFPAGTTLSQLEILARGPLYSQGRDYGHGTTHEPGYYRDNEWGIRLENIVTIVKANFAETTENKTFLKFETVTLVPYELNMINVALLTPDQVNWVNAYHSRVRAEVRPLLALAGETQALAWLDARTLVPLTPVC
ncbi:hypothetical protein B566_EDAN011507 [Ephemera danica]|nr:hypothetical protein B566_EDAN011507 [Ephemera danica]